MNITILWSSLASYSVSFFRELARQGCNIQLIYQPAEICAPYHKFDLSFCKMSLEDSEVVKLNLESLVINFDPVCILMSSWNYPDFMRLAKKVRKKGIYVVAGMDNQWDGTFKQYFGVMTSKLFLKPSIDTFLVAGDRQAYFARRLGYECVLYGLYAADVERFTCTVPISKRARNFLFIGRLSSVKGVEELIQAYLLYRKQVEKPWGIIVAGTGPLEVLFRNVPGVDLLGFVQPTDLPRLMHNARCLVLPSLWEPWGVVLHEATAAGLPIIATYSCGAITMFARDGVNGYVISPQPHKISKAMVRISNAPEESLDRMSASSSTLAEQWNPNRLAIYFVDTIRHLIAER